MIKTGLVGYFSESELSAIARHPDLIITGCFFPGELETRSENITRSNFPELSKEELFRLNKALIFAPLNLKITGLISDALKKSIHFLFLDCKPLINADICELIKLHDEAQTVIHARQAERSMPVLNACLSMIVHPCIVNINLISPAPFNTSLLRMLDALLYLCPLNIQKVYTTRRNQEIPASSAPVSVRMEFDNGSSANLIYSDVADVESLTIEIYQKLKRLIINVINNEVKIIEKSASGNIINSVVIEFPYNADALIKDELDIFHNAIINDNTTGKALFDVFRLTEISRKIIAKAGFPD
jgi:hypothetical protein